MGTLTAIWLKRAHRGVMDPVAEAAVSIEDGLIGSVDRSRRRQVTLLAEEDWARALAEAGATVDPAARRANLLLKDIALAHTRNRVLRVGTARLRIGGETTPCERMDEAWPGLRAALVPAWRGGVFATVLTAGAFRVGDEVAWDPPHP